MNPRQAELGYRRVAVENASSVGLVIMMYDLLVNDLRQAGKAIDTGDVDTRSMVLKHAFLVLQQLQGSLNWEKGGDAAKRLSDFYTVLRARIWEAHVKKDRAILEEQIRLLIDVRQAWAQVDPASSPAAVSSDQRARTADDEKNTSCWTA